MTNCVTPDGKIWNTRRRRLLVGRERLALQCVFPKHECVQGFSQKLEGDLAGNAFNGCDFAVMLLAMLTVLGAASGFQEHLTDEPAKRMPVWFKDLIRAQRISQNGLQ